MKKVVKILKCSNDIMWYKDSIGECYEFLFDDCDNKIVVDLANSRGDRGSVNKEDAEIFEVEDDFEIRELNYIPTEIDLLKEETLQQSEYMIDMDYRLINLELGL